ncbi:VOC family protein [Streptomyces brasiliensis]|uniref:VOC family protein n=1 Tax=Streptomyces brasiliensis TaxID=1954 RepID=UPI001E3A9CF6|nr:hypothetical protein [Streptomyces brasiliensis]
MRTAVLSDRAGLRVEFAERSGSAPVTHTDPFAATAAQTFTHLALEVTDLDAASARLTGERGAGHVSPPAPASPEACATRTSTTRRAISSS